MSKQAWISSILFGPPSWGMMYGPVWAVMQGTTLLSRDSPITAMQIANALCGF